MSKIGPYVYDKFLGAGAFGKVYKGYHEQTKEVVAVKVMDKAKISDPFLIQSLKTEIGVMKALKSSHVVRMYEFQEDSHNYYIVLEFCPDGDLDKYVEKKGGRLQEEEAVKILSQLMQGFQELVSLGYIHRDIKPANSLIKDGVHKVADFGFAVKIDTTGKQFINEPLGTPLFMAPQILQEKPYTAKSDIWSIGMMYYLTLFGNTPWPCRDLKSYTQNVMTQPLRFPYNQPISAQSQDFLKRTLQKDESSRIGWAELFKHPLLVSDSPQAPVQQPSVKIDDRGVKILSKMQDIVRQNNIDIHKIFSNFDKSKSGDLSPEEFYKMLLVIDPAISYTEGYHIFTQVDQSKDGKVQFNEFESIFTHYDFHDVNDYGQRIIIDLREMIRANNINVRDLFKNFDKDNSAELSFDEFSKFLKIMAPGLKDGEIRKVFDKFDNDKSNSVSFEEFRLALVQGTTQDSKYDLNIEKQNRILSELKRIIQQNKLNLQQIFKNFDKSGDGKLDLNEFHKFLQVIDKNIHINDTKNVFARFDTGKSGDVSLAEFCQVFQK